MSMEHPRSAGFHLAMEGRGLVPVAIMEHMNAAARLEQTDAAAQLSARSGHGDEHGGVGK